MGDSAMESQRILFFGGAGQVGRTFQCVASSPFFPDEWNLVFSTRNECDITNPAALRNHIHDIHPRLIINAAGLTSVDEAERNPGVADAVNFHAVANMAAQCSSLDIPLIHLSTDYVFDGTQGRPYREDDLMNPVNKYGASKMMGEEAVRHELPWHVILRVSSVFGPYRANIFTKLIEMIDAGKPLRMVTDIMSAPTPAVHIVEAIIVMVQALLNGKADGYGTFHLCGAPACSRFDFARAVFDAYGSFGGALPSLSPALQADFPTAAERPAYTIMACDKLESVYGIKQRAWSHGLAHAIEVLRSGREGVQCP